jgi:FlaA1/EpsC-like NDP-sugar epimerase
MITGHSILVIAISVDICLCVITVALAYRLRLDVWVFPVGNQWFSYGASILIALPLFIKFGLYRAIFRYVGWGAMMSIVLACIIYGVAYASIFSFAGITDVPRTTGILQPILLFLAVGASRAIARYWLGGGYATILGLNARRRVLIYGAGQAGRQLAAGLANSNDMQVVGLLDDDPTLHGSVLNGKTIFPSDQMVTLIDTLGVADVLLALPSASRQRRNEIIESLRGHAVAVRTLPGIFDLADGKVTLNDLRPLEIEDLLGRDPVAPHPLLLSKCVTGKIVLVTGAGGSIGSELCRQIIALNPSRLILFDHSEYNLYAIDQELASMLQAKEFKPDIIPCLGSVLDERRVNEIFRDHKPDTIYHAAAYKHVPLVETNPIEGVRNNVLGTRCVALAADKYDAENFVLISTDKAVRPPNIMGATKRVSEMLLQALAAAGPKTKFSMVRFGNVLGSSGSVVPLFRKQIAQGGPVTVTHADVTRYFMTIPEAAQLVIQAGALAEGGDVFVLDMGEPVRIMDLARRMIELSGLRARTESEEDGDIEIQVVGLRSAEKLYEELLIGDNPSPTAHSRIMRARDEAVDSATLDQWINDALKIMATGDKVGICALLSALVPTLELRQPTAPSGPLENENHSAPAFIQPAYARTARK